MGDTVIGKKGLTLIMGGNRWGAGADLAAAKKEWQRQGGVLSRGYTVLTFDADTEFHGVDQMGRLHYRGNGPAERQVKPRT